MQQESGRVLSVGKVELQCYSVVLLVTRFCEWEDIRSNSLTKDHCQGNEAGDISYGDGRHFHPPQNAETLTVLLDVHFGDMTSF